jgi:hypothetical protein
MCGVREGQPQARPERGKFATNTTSWLRDGGASAVMVDTQESDLQLEEVVPQCHCRGAGVFGPRIKHNHDRGPVDTLTWNRRVSKICMNRCRR